MNLADDMEEFVTLHRGHGRLTADAGEPTPNGYPLEIAVKSQRRWIIETPMHSVVSESGRFSGW